MKKCPGLIMFLQVFGPLMIRLIILQKYELHES